jgi:hypothetical protein
MFLANAIVTAVQGGLASLVGFLPALIAAILIMTAGWFVGGALGNLVTTLLRRIGFDNAAARAGVVRFMQQAGVWQMTAAGVVGLLVKWFFRLIFLEAAASAVRLDAVTDVVNRIVLFIPNLVVALIVLMAGLLLARFAGGLARAGATQAGFDSPSLLGSVAQYAIIGFAVIVAVEQIGIATALINMLFAALVGALALAFGLAFGLGGREVAGQVWRHWYARAQELAPQLEAAARPALHDAAQPSSSPSPPAYAGTPVGAQPTRADGESRLRQPGESWRSDH